MEELVAYFIEITAAAPICRFITTISLNDQCNLYRPGLSKAASGKNPDPGPA